MTTHLLTTATAFFDRMYGHENPTETDSPLHNAEPATPPNSPVGDLSRIASMREVSVDRALRTDKRTTETKHTIITGQLSGKTFKLVGTLTTEEIQQIFDTPVDEKQKTILGEGCFGKVRLALCEGKWVAVKKIKNIDAAKIEIAQHLLAQEKLKDSQYIIQLQDYAVTIGKDGKDKAYLFVDFINSGLKAISAGAGDLATLLDSSGNFPKFRLKDRLSDLVRQCTEAVRDFHHAKLSHRDIKAENFLLTAWGTIKLADYASVESADNKILPRNGFTYQQMPSALVKTLPEKAGGAETHWSGEQLDRFALGVTLLELRNRVQWKSKNILLIHNQQHSLSTEKIQKARDEVICQCGLNLDPKTIRGETLDEIIGILLFDQPEGESISSVLKRPYFSESYDKTSWCTIL